MEKCVVCFGVTKSCVPAPHAPYSRWLCEECWRNKRISYRELVEAFSGNLVNDKDVGTQIRKYKDATLRYFGVDENKFNADILNYQSGGM